MAEKVIKVSNPLRLYNLALNSVANHFQHLKNEVKVVPNSVQFDIYHRLYEERKLCMLIVEFSDLNIFSKMLKTTNKRNKLLQSFQSLLDHGTFISKELSDKFVREAESLKNTTDINEVKIENAIGLGLKLGGFLNEVGRYPDSEKVLRASLDLCTSFNFEDELKYLRWSLDCLHKLLHAQTVYCRFSEAEETLKIAADKIEKLREYGDVPSLAGLYAEFSLFYFLRSKYDQAYLWSERGLQEVNETMNYTVIIDVLRQASKSCVVKRKFDKAEGIIKEAVYLARDIFGDSHPKYADCLMDYGFYLLNFDSVSQSVDIYQKALEIRQKVFGIWNIHVATAHEDLAYALYVFEYTSGRFNEARDNAEKSISIMDKILPENHLLLVSANRVKALILEEIALDTMGNEHEKGLLSVAEKLHLSALKLSTAAFGEINVQNAKHYGNLGRLYQSMRKFEEAEAMHLKAIEIKEKLLGPEDYEVALSLGHLASLYNYHMNNYRKAEQLYLRSIEIGIKLFGKGYSGLEYDYRGLIRIYHELNDIQKVADFTRVLHRWKILRDQKCKTVMPALEISENPKPIQDVINTFFALGVSEKPK